MNNGIVQIEIGQFALIYLLLIIILAVMKKCKIKQTKLVIVASLRMSVQLTLCGFILTYIFKNPHPLFIVAYFAIMTVFAIHRVLSRNKNLNKSFKIAIGVSVAFSGLLTISYFVCLVIGQSIFNPQYFIPIGGMVMGNTMTGVSLGVKNFNESIEGQKSKIDALLNIGVAPKEILMPSVNRALETALLPTLNNMLGMGIVSLPGMMTGQILSGTLPTTAILYQISVMIAIATAVCLSTFGSLYIGYKSLYNKDEQIVL